ncbi:MAG: hypothetical protein A2542_01210 [Parcubacteria group bacterium RIFOXYD2_FULL_52_8]|nr:MAG: hypothetical protein A2542_01210 [Parcubacteria group bacterium RIFOXYD2_FULL_52_8]
MTNVTPAATQTDFKSLGVAPLLLKILDEQKLVTPSPIQVKAIPLALEGKDVIGIAQTGTGKTFSFGLPMIQRLAIHKGMGLVVVPTRELALQVEQALLQVGRAIGLRTAVLVGGAPMGKQIQAIKAKPHVIVATPGRLNDHLMQKTVDLKGTTILVLDEADHMLDMGFEPQIRAILQHVPKERQTLLFSATMPPKIRAIAANYMKSPVSVEVAPQGTSAEKVHQELYFVKKEDKARLLEKVLGEHAGSVLVFSRTKHGAKRLSRHVSSMGHTSANIQGNLSLPQRKAALEGFKSGKHRVLVATDIAARGIDVNDIALVVNYDLPDNPEDYVHRIGRTARAGKSGKAISFAEHNQRYDVKTIERLIRKDLPESQLPELPPARIVPNALPDRDERPRGFFPRRGGQPQRSSYDSSRGPSPYGRSAPRHHDPRRATHGASSQRGRSY